MQKERETFDVQYYQLSDDAAGAALKLDSKNVTALTIETWVALGRHDFATAGAMAQRAIQADPSNPDNYGNLGDAEANLGNYDAMLRAYQRMADLKPDLASYNRASYARWLYGDVRGATRFMLLAIRASSSQPENVAWCESQLGDDFFNAGFVLGAQQMYQTALKAFPHYARALAGLAGVEVALRHPSAAIRYYQQAIAVVPLPQYLVGLGDLYSRLGRNADAQREYAVIKFIEHIFAINHVRFGIDEAQFEADHNLDLGQALKLATAEAANRHDIQTMDTFGWVLYKSGRYTDAWNAEKQALRLGTHYALYDFHAGMIQEKLGNLAQAQSYLSMALMLNPNFNVLYAPVAQHELVSLNRRAARPKQG
jgi:tetratricopeptide (TPR) repeat protein